MPSNNIAVVILKLVGYFVAGFLIGRLIGALLLP